MGNKNHFNTVVWYSSIKVLNFKTSFHRIFPYLINILVHRFAFSRSLIYMLKKLTVTTCHLFYKNNWTYVHYSKISASRMLKTFDSTWNFQQKKKNYFYLNNKHICKNNRKVSHISGYRWVRSQIPSTFSYP